MLNKKTNFLAISITLVFAVLIASIVFLSMRNNSSNTNIILPSQIDPNTGNVPAITLDNVEQLKAVMLDSENFFDVLHALERYENYLIAGTVQLLDSSGASASYTISQSHSKDYTRATVLPAGMTSPTNYLFYKEKVYTWKTGSMQYETYSDRFMTPDQTVFIPPYSTVDTIEKVDIQSFNNLQCLVFSTINPVTKYLYQYYVSTEYGVLLSARIQKGSSTIYLFEATDVNFNEQDSSLFLLPDGTRPT